MDEEVSSVLPDLTKLALRQIHLKDSVDACVQTPKIVQESVIAMNSRLNIIEILIMHDIFEVNCLIDGKLESRTQTNATRSLGLSNPSRAP